VTDHVRLLLHVAPPDGDDGGVPAELRLIVRLHVDLCRTRSAACPA
jgi:hypothetical protein